MGVIVAFNYTTWVQLFPQFAYVPQPVVTEFFNLATSFHRNDGGGPVSSSQMQTSCLNLVLAHLLQLFGPKADGTGQPNRDANVVGRITNASEGSVSVATELAAGQNQNASFWTQTQYGEAYWALTAPFRTMRYILAPPKPVNPWPIFGSGPGGWWGNW